MPRRPTLAAESTSDMLPCIVNDAMIMFAQNIEVPLDIAEVTDMVGISVRQLERMFHESTGNTHLGHYKILRMHHVRQLLLYGNDSMIQAALAVGYASWSAMAKNHRDVFGINPSEDCQKVNMFCVRGNTIVPNAKPVTLNFGVIIHANRPIAVLFVLVKNSSDTVRLCGIEIGIN